MSQDSTANFAQDPPANGAPQDPAAIWLVPATRRVLDSVADFFVAYDRHLDIVFVNRALAEASRDRHKDLVGRNHWDVWPDMRGSVVEESYSRALETGLPVHFEYRYPRGDVWVEVDVFPIGGYLHVYFRDVTDRKRAEAERARHEETVEEILSALPHIAWAIDDAGDPTYVNQRWRDYTGVDGMSRENIRQCIHPEDLEGVVQASVAARSTSEERSYRLRLRRWDGEYRWHHVRSAPLPKQVGETRFIGTSTDVHDEQLAQEALRESAQLQRLVFDAVPACVSYLDSEERFVATNVTCARWFGMTTEDVIGLTLRELVGDETYALRRPYVERVLRGERVQYESPVRLHDGKIVRALTDYVPDERDGAVRGFVAMVQDVSEQRAIEWALRESAERSRLLIESVPEMAWTADAEGRIDYYNQRWYEFTGASKGVRGDESWTPVVHPDDLPMTHAAWSRSVATGEPYEISLRLRGRDGGPYRWFLARARPIRDASGRILRWFGMTMDVHEARVKQEALNFLSELTDGMRPLDDAEERLRVATAMLGRHFAASRCAYAEVLEDGDAFNVLQDWSPHLPSTVGTYSLRLFGRKAYTGLRSGRTLQVDDVDRDLDLDDGADMFNAIGIKAIVCCPLVKNGRLVALMALHQETPRAWTTQEVELIEMVAERCWASIERVRAVRALQRSEERHRLLFEITEAARRLSDPQDIVKAAIALLGERLGASRCSYAEVQEDEETYVVETDWRSGVPSVAGTYHLSDFGERVAREQRAGVPTIVEDVDAEYGFEVGTRYAAVQVAAYIVCPLLRNGRLSAMMGVHQATPRKWTDEEVRLVETVADRCWSEIERARAEAKLREANEELERRVTERTRQLEVSHRNQEAWNYSVSHDLRAPLRAVVSTSRILIEDHGAELSQSALSLLERQAAAAGKLAALVDELLKTARLARQEMRTDDLDVTGIAEEAARDELAHASRRFDLRIQAGMRGVGDATLVKLIFSNYFANAMKYSAEGTSIEAGEVQIDGKSAYFVRDHGIGFDMRYEAKVWRPFERLVDDSEYRGTGIGLYNVASMVERLGGRAWAESEPGVGSTFYFTLT